MSDRYGPRSFVVGGFLLLGPFLILLRLPDRDSISEIAFLCVLLALVGVASALIIAPVMAEISAVVSDLEGQKPGRFGPNGALAQAVSSPFPPIPREAMQISKQVGGSDKVSTVCPTLLLLAARWGALC